ncbi:hypothetical protein [Singulisphaera sp. PoT]|uniref:hypothetical protein n=1 Tax=Singulisphaera sp. PoT TaxID=3411797 RepID=UPI003BF5EBA2
MMRTGMVADGLRRRLDARVVLLAGLLGWTAVATSLDCGHVGVVLDDGIYLASAQSLRDSKGYALPSRPGNPSPKYPIGLPGAISMALRFAPGSPSLSRDIAVARGVVLASGWVFGLGGFAWLTRIGLGPWSATLIVLTTLFHHVALIGCSTTIFSDMPFCAIAYLLMARWASTRPLDRPWRASLADGVFAGLAMLIRGNGISLALAALVASAIGPKARGRVVACALGLVLVLLPAKGLIARRVHPVASGDYALEFRAGWSSAEAGLRIVGGNTWSTLFDFPTDVLFPNLRYTAPLVQYSSVHPGGSALIRGIFTAIVAIGVFRLARSSTRRDLPAWVHFAATAGIFAVWPWPSIIDRFLLSLFPMVLLAFGLGVDLVARRILPMAYEYANAPERPRFATPLVFAALLLPWASGLSVAGRSVMVFHRSGRQWPGGSTNASLNQALAYLRTRTEADSVVAAYWPETVYLYTARQAVPLLEDDDVVAQRYGRRERLLSWMAEIPGRPFYLLVRSPDEDPKKVDLGQAEALAADPGLERREVYRTPDDRYRVEQVVHHSGKLAGRMTPGR